MLWFLLPALSLTPLAFASELDCDGRSSLLLAEWNSIPDAPEGVKHWFFPVSPEKPEMVTAARLDVEWVRTEEFWEARLRFSFPDPKPFGIPFTFQKVALEWAGAPTPVTIEQDWTASCTGPGRALFPGQTFSTIFALTAEPGSPVESVKLRVWGQRF